jgi:hypothetical protein
MLRIKLAVDFEDVVSGLQAGPVCGSPVQDRHRGEQVVLENHFHAGLGRRALVAFLVPGEFLGIQVRGIGIQGVHHAPQGPLEDLPFIFLGYRFLGNFIQRVGK